MADSWEIYEDAARKVLFNLRKKLGLSEIEMKQVLAGKSGTKWEIDAKAWVEGSQNFLVVEARRYTGSRLSQEAVAALAFRISDVGATGGIVVSPLPLQRGAKKVAASSGIEHIRLTADSTPEMYLAEYLGKKFHGVTVTDGLKVGVSIRSITVKRPDLGT